MAEKTKNSEHGFSYMDALVAFILTGLMLASLIPFFTMSFQILPGTWKLQHTNHTLILFFRDLHKECSRVDFPWWSSGESVENKEGQIRLPVFEGQTLLYREGPFWYIRSDENLRRYRLGETVSISLQYSESGYPVGLVCKLDDAEYTVYFACRVLENAGL